jgi:glyoxylase I family protein
MGTVGTASQPQSRCNGLGAASRQQSNPVRCLPLVGRRGMSAVEMAAVLGVHHVQLSYPLDVKLQVAFFYGQLLGLQELRSASASELVLAYQAGAQRIDLVPRKRASSAGGGESLGHLALHVANAQTLQQRLLAHGQTALALVGVQEGWRFYAKDPGGNTLELLQLHPPHRSL